MHIRKWLVLVACALATATLAGCGFHLRQSAALPAVMQHQVYLQVSGGGAFARSLAASLRASKVNVLSDSAPGVATLAVPTAAFSSNLMTTSAVERVGEYVVGMQVRFTLVSADGKTVVPMQTISLSHEFAIDQTEFSAISSETEAIERSLVREMTDAVMRRLEAQAQRGTLVAPASAASAG
ncbi:MAG TPA: LPS assembly lipoprotein LptE [Rhodanobacteraceae bacterium]